MKKLITIVAMVVSLVVYANAEKISYNADKFCKNGEKEIRNNLSEILIDNYVKVNNKRNASQNVREYLDDIAFMAGKIDALKEILDKEGVSSSISLNLSNGSTLKFEAQAFYVSLTQYMLYLNDNYSENDKMLLRYLTYVSRPSNSFMSFTGHRLVDAGLFDEKLNHIFILNEIDRTNSYNLFDPFNTIVVTFGHNNFSTSKNIGHLDITFQDFMYLVLTGDFVEADKVLIESIRAPQVYLESSCRIFNKLKG